MPKYGLKVFDVAGKEVEPKAPGSPAQYFSLCLALAVDLINADRGRINEHVRVRRLPKGCNVQSIPTILDEHFRNNDAIVAAGFLLEWGRIPVIQKLMTGVFRPDAEIIALFIAAASQMKVPEGGRVEITEIPEAKGATPTD